MKILMTTDTVGGVWSYSLELADALAPYDVEVVLAAMGQPSEEQRLAAASVPNLCLFAENFALEWMEDPWEEVAAAGQWLLGLASAVRPSIVHLNNYCHAALPWEAPVVVVGHSCVYSWFAAVHRNTPDERWQPYREAVQEGLQAADLVVAPTRHMLSALEYFYGPLPQRMAIWNGCAPDRFEINAKQRFIFAAGRFWDEAKNIRALASAATSLDWPVAVAGLHDPSGRDSRAEHVDWLGCLSRDEMAVVYSSASIYALPALYEPFGLTALEAALSGCALVLGDIPSLHEVWGDAATYVPPRDPEQLARTLNHLSRDDELRAGRALEALRRGRQLSSARMATAYYLQYQRLHASTRRRITLQGAW